MMSPRRASRWPRRRQTSSLKSPRQFSLEERVSRSEAGGSNPRKVTALAKRVRLSATTAIAPSPFGSVHTHGLVERALDGHVFGIVGLKLGGAFSRGRLQLTDHPGECRRIGRIEGERDIEADWAPLRGDRSRYAPTHGRRESSDEEVPAQERAQLRVVGLLELLR
jgi:hypothetical protein